MRNEDDMFVPGDWIIHDGPSATGDRSFLHSAVRLVEETKIHYVVESVLFGEMVKMTLWKGEWSKFTLATKEMADVELRQLSE